MSVDAVVVLANLMDASGNLNDETTSRVVTAISELYKSEAKNLVTCGWAYREDSDICVADAMADFAERLGVNRSRIIAETNSRDTVGDAVFSKLNVAVPNRWSRIIVVTSDYHTDRTGTVFRFVYGPSFEIDVRSAPSFFTQEMTDAEARSLQAFWDTFAGIHPGDDDAIFDRLSERHPFYNGNIYPRVSRLRR